MQFNLRSWFKWIIYLSLFLSFLIYGKVYVDHDGPTAYTKFSVHMWDRNIVDFTRKRTFDYTGGGHKQNGYYIEVLFANREIINHKWKYEN